MDTGWVLRLHDDQRAYLCERAGKHPTRPRSRARQKVRPYIQRVLDHITDTPAMVARRNLDILAWNPLAAALMIDFSRIPEREPNFVRLIFTHPTMRDLYPDWEGLARMCVAYLRMEAAETPTIPASPRSSASYPSRIRSSAGGGQATASRSGGGTRTFEHPVVGEITLGWDALASDGNPDQQLIVYTAHPARPPIRPSATLRPGP